MLPPCLCNRSKALSSVLLRFASTEASTSIKSNPTWYKDVTVTPNAKEGEYLIQLDKRSLRTPGRHLLSIPSHPLALAIAAEWQWQDRKIRPFTMPLMSLAATAIDQPKPREKVIETLQRFLHTDALTCEYDRGDVADKQKQMHSPIVEWASQHLKVSFVRGSSIFGVQQPEDVEEAVTQFLDGLSPWELAAVEALSGACKSFILGTAVFKGRVSVSEALQIARLEENMQLEQWGYVEGGHDIDDADIQNVIRSASVFARLLRSPDTRQA